LKQIYLFVVPAKQNRSDGGSLLPRTARFRADLFRALRKTSGMLAQHGRSRQCFTLRAGRCT
jgi:hypothetical protein